MPEQNKKPQRNQGVVSCWPSTPRLGPALTCVLYPVRLLWRNLIFHFASIYQLQITCWLVVRSHISIPLFVLGTLLVEPMWVLCLLPQSGGSHACRSRCVWNSLFPWCHSAPLAINIFCLLIHIDSWAWGKGLNHDSPFGTAPNSPTLCTLSHCGSP